MGYKGISEAEAIRRRGKFGKPKRGGSRADSWNDEDAIRRRNEEIESESQTDSESGNSNSSDEESESEEETSSESEDSGEESEDDENNSDKKLPSKPVNKSIPTKQTSAPSSGEPSVSRSQTKKDLQALALIKQRREEAARKRNA
jgi:hypothetical protein